MVLKRCSSERGEREKRFYGRIMIRSNGVVHVNSMGPQEIDFSKNNIDKLQIELLNNDGTPYESHQLNHNISLVVTYFQG